MGSARISCNMLPNGRAVVSRVLKASVPVRGLARGYKWADMGRKLACGFVPCHPTLGALSDFRHFSVLLTPKSTTAYMSVSSTSDKQLELGLPLPKVAGITSLKFPLTATVGDLKAAIATAANIPATSVHVKDALGDTVSSCSRLAMVVDSQWSVNVGPDFTVSAVSATFPVPLAGFGGNNLGYNALKSAVLSKSGTVSYSEFVSLARSAAASAGISSAAFPSTLDSWELTLHQEGLILHLSASEDAAIRDIVFIKPQLAHADLLLVLDLHTTRISAKLSDAVTKLANVSVALKSMDDFTAVARERARRRIRNISLAAGAFMVVQWGVIADLIYEESWDVMEPIVYFVSVGYGLLFYLFFFMRTKRDPNTTSIFNHFFNTSLEKAHRALATKESWRSVSRFTAERQSLEKLAEKLQSQIKSLRNSLPPETKA